MTQQKYETEPTVQWNGMEHRTEQNVPWNEMERTVLRRFWENTVAVQRKWNGPFLEQFFDAYLTCVDSQISGNTQTDRQTYMYTTQLL